MIKYLQERFKKLGIPLKQYPCMESYNLLARVEGKEKGIPILFSSHMDTVLPCNQVKPQVTKTKITSDGTTILGADDKAAIACFLEALECLREKNLPHGPLEFLFSCAEELGLYGIKAFDMSPLKSKYAFVFDSGGSVGKIILKAPFHMTLDVKIKGKAAHAGMEPEKGISAIRVISEILSSIPHGRIDGETTVNAGIISGGRATNIVAEEAYTKIEARSLNRQKLTSVIQIITKTIQEISSRHGARAGIQKTMEYYGFSIKPGEEIVKIVNRALENLNITPEYIDSGGGSDTNVFNRAGIKAINLSIGMRDVHSTKEHILIRDLVDGTGLVLSLIDAVRKFQ